MSNAELKQPRTELDWAHDAGTVEQVLAQVAVKVRAKKRRRRLRTAAGGAVLAALAVALWVVPWMRHTGTIATLPATRQVLTLADGSRVDLNAQSAVFTDFRGSRRLVRLEKGEAFFVVAKGRAEPFTVETPGGRVQVTGTEFNVRLSGGEAEVTLVEGGVSVLPDTDGTALALQAGQQAALGGGNAKVRTLSGEEMDAAVAWRAGRLVLDHLTLAEAVQRVSAYHGVPIAVAHEVAALRPGGTCPLANLPDLLAALEETLPVRVLPVSDGSYRIIAR